MRKQSCPPKDRQTCAFHGPVHGTSIQSSSGKSSTGNRIPLDPFLKWQRTEMPRTQANRRSNVWLAGVVCDVINTARISMAIGSFGFSLHSHITEGILLCMIEYAVSSEVGVCVETQT